MQKADLQPEGGKSPNHVALDETVIQLNNERYWPASATASTTSSVVIQLNNERYWLLAAVDPETNEFLHVRPHPACTIALTERFLRELREKHDIADALFLVDGAPWLQAALHRYNLRFQHVTHGNRNAVERVFKEIKRRTNKFANHFRHASAESAESWLQTLAFAWNQLI